MKSFFKKIIVLILTWESRVVLKKYKPDIIAVTGSLGKTSTKDAIYSLISPSVFVRKSDKSFNSEIGLPLTILGCSNAWNDPLAWLGNIARGLSLIMYRGEYPKCLILEIGADHPGDIKKLTRWFHPDIAVITAVSKVPVHIEFFSSPKAVLEEKLALAKAVKKGAGKTETAKTAKTVKTVKSHLVLPATDADILAVRNDPTLVDVPCLTFGINSLGDVTASSVHILYSDKRPVGMSFHLTYAGNSIPVSIYGIVGFQHVYSMVAASAAALAYGISLDAIVKAIPDHHAPRGRMNVLAGIGGSILIDDSYNASPDAVKEALSVLCEVNPFADIDQANPISTPTSISVTTPSPIRRIAVLGDMMELGTYSLEEHRKIGEVAAHALMSQTRNLLITVGIRARDIKEGAITVGMSKASIKSFDTSAEAAEYLKKIAGNLGKGGSILDVILIKGSQSPRLERVTRALLAAPDGSPATPTLASELLVRQESEWLARA